MSSSENKVMAAPFKTMDIKAAFLAASNRKRKASSPIVQKNQTKNIRLSDEKNEEVIEILDKDPVVTGDCKENTDLNTLQTLTVSPINDKVSPLKEITKDDSKNSACSSGDEKALSSEADSITDELNSSALNSSINTAELSERTEDKNEKDLNTSVDSKKSGIKSKLKEKDDNQNEARPKKKRKMTPEEAKVRAEEREKSLQERLMKKQQLEEKKLQKKLEREKQKQMKEHEKLEKEEKRKEQERLKQEKKELEEKERLQKLKEKEEKKKQQEMLHVMKQEEKKKKEEMRLKKEEETKKAEEEKQKAKIEKEHKEKERKEKAKAAFMKFFKKGGANATFTVQAVEKELAFKPFQVSDAMSLAPVVPRAAKERFDKEGLDHALKFQDGKKLYIQVLKSGIYKVVKQRKRLRKPRTSDTEVIILDNTAQAELFFTAKLLQFSENVRPPYWGTWRKRSSKVGPRNPFGEDEMFDYSVDSDEEWDEGGPGESISGTDNEVESEDDYEVDNEFFVPHGYLSAEEEKEEDEVENDPEKQKAVLKQKQQEFESERKKKTTELKPIILGCYFENSATQDSGLATFLATYAAEILSDTPIPTCFTVQKIQAETSNSNSPNVSVCKKVPEEAMPHLIRLMHGNPKGRGLIIKEFQTFWQQHKKEQTRSNEASPEKPQPTPAEENPDAPADVIPVASDLISKRQLILTFKTISTYGKCPNPALKKCCWWVHDKVREKYGLSDVTLPNEANCAAQVEVEVVVPVEKKDSVSIKEFFKNCEEQEIQEQ